MSVRVIVSMVVAALFLVSCSFSASFMQNGLGGPKAKKPKVHRTVVHHHRSHHRHRHPHKYSHPRGHRH